MQTPRVEPEGLISSVTTRRQIIRHAALSSGALLVGSLGLGEFNPLWAALDLTESTTAGPFYKPGAPFRSLLIEGGVQGTPFLLSGRVLDPAGAVMKNAVVDLWHADSTGAYDTQGFRLRGRVRTDAEGRYSFRTIKPKFYSGRPAHFHFKVYGDDITELTTQLFFKGDALLGKDRIVRSSLVLAPKDQDAGLAASFDFVVRKR